MTSEKGFRGDLGLISLFDLGQLLMLNRATGCLTIQSRDLKGYLYFSQGRLIHALDDVYVEGEEAACRLFAWQEGSFEFRHEAFDGVVTIESGTDALMLEAARRIDEAQDESGQESSSQERLRESQHAFEALREAFGQVAREAKTLGRPPGQGVEAPTSQIYSLSEPGDRLVYRPGHPPRIRQGETWSDLSSEPLPDGIYEDLRLRLLQACSPHSAVATGASALRRIVLADGHSIALEFVNEGPDESLWLRPVDLPPPAPSRLVGDLERLEGIVEQSLGLTLVGGPTLDATRMMLHTFVSLLGSRAGGTIVLASTDETYRHRDSAAVILRIAPSLLAPALGTLEPDVVVLDAMPDPGEPGLAELVRVPRLVGAVVTPDAASMLPRWLVRVFTSSPEAVRVLLEGITLSLIVAAPGAGDGQALSFGAWTLTAEQRSLALAGDTRSLAAALSERPGRPKLKLHTG